MKLSHLRNFFVISMIFSAIAVPAYSQGTGDAPQPVSEAQVAAEAVDAQVKEIAIYGEVQSVDATANVISVQYYDYDSDSEKTADVAVAGDSRMENATSLAEIKKGDWVDVTYIVKEGKNVAKIVTVEKEELPAPEEATPQSAASLSESTE